MPAKKHTKLKLSFSFPVTLYICFTALIIYLLDSTFVPSLITNVFSVPASLRTTGGFDWKNVLDYLRLFFHVLGHSSWSSLVTNLAFILILAPNLEEQYGSGVLALMVLVCAFVSGILNVCFNPQPLLGSDGVVFMLVLVTSANYITKREVPLTAVVLIILFVLKNLVNTGDNEKIRALIHIAGGVCGSLLVFLAGEKSSVKRKTSKASAASHDGLFPAADE